MDTKTIKTDESTGKVVGCFVSQLGATITEFVEKFADENGNVDINELAEILEVIAFAYTRVKFAYEGCLDKKFSIGENSNWGKLLVALLEALNKSKT